MERKNIKYRKVAHQDYRVYINNQEFRFSNSCKAKKVYLLHIKPKENKK